MIFILYILISHVNLFSQWRISAITNMFVSTLQNINDSSRKIHGVHDAIFTHIPSGNPPRIPHRESRRIGYETDGFQQILLAVGRQGNVEDGEEQIDDASRHFSIRRVQYTDQRLDGRAVAAAAEMRDTGPSSQNRRDGVATGRHTLGAGQGGGGIGGWRSDSSGSSWSGD